MKIAHLILTHKNPVQLERLLNALDHPAFTFYIHLDKKSDRSAFAYLYERSNVHEIKNRTPVYWAGWGTIQATINGFNEIPVDKYDYINVISAQDFPIKPAHYIYNYFVENKGKEFITCYSIDGEWREAASRVRKYHLINWRVPGKFKLEKIVNAVLPARKFPFDYKIVGRANWFTLTPSAISYALDFLKQHPSITRYFKYCWGADEFIFSTILFNSHFKNAITDNVVYVDWTGQTQGHPRILIKNDLPALQQTDKLFARKFDIQVDASILDDIEAYIQTESYAS
jgi:hypothetical protein